MDLFRFYSNPTETNGIRVSIVGTHSEGVLKLAASRCSAKDHFIKKKGRAIAEGRLAKGKLYKSIPMNECDVKTFVEQAKAAALDIASDPRKVF